MIPLQPVSLVMAVNYVWREYLMRSEWIEKAVADQLICNNKAIKIMF